MGPVSLLFAALFGLASWLAPNHSSPWLSFHGELMMAVACLLALLGELAQRRVRAPSLTPLAGLTLAVALVPVVQVAAGLIPFAGDGWVAAAYLLGFALAQVLGQRLAWRWGAPATAEALAGLFVAGAVASVGLQLYQWLQLSGLGLFASEMPSLGTPYANFAQPNHLATALFMGLAGVLYLYERRRVGGGVATLAALFLMFAMAMTGSRTAWVAVALLVPALAWAGHRLALRITPLVALGLGLAFVGMVVAWPLLNEVMLLAPGRTLADQARAGPRLRIYATMLDAVSRHPWVGYGWGQGLVAQGTVLDQHPLGGHLVGSSHNLVIDLMVWNGVPLALLITAGLAGWCLRQGRLCRDATQLFLLSAIGGVAVHAMLEYPLSYAYFLLPVGVMVGLLDAAAPARWSLPLPRGATLAVAGLATALLAVITVEYLEVEANTELLSLEVARVGTHRINSHAPELRVLTQWQAYLRYARIEPHAGMSEAEMAWMRGVVERFPFSPALREYAEVNALNGRADVARDTLVRLCQLHTPQRCHNALQMWREDTRESFPQLASVPLPPEPAPPGAAGLRMK